MLLLPTEKLSINKWIQLGVIEPSQSPWAAPAFIVYRNGKPPMAIDYWKLNEITISNLWVWAIALHGRDTRPF